MWSIFSHPGCGLSLRMDATSGEFSLRIIGFSRWFFQRSARSTFNFEAKMKVAYGNKGTRPAALQECDDDICGVPHVLHQPHCMAVLLLRTRALAAHSCFLHGCRTPLLKPSFWHLMGTIPRTLTFRAIIVVLFSTYYYNNISDSLQKSLDIMNKEGTPRMCNIKDGASATYQ
ncbi:hypothetical protein AB1N83_002739 [Pleurotus pulmonarius]